MEISSSQLLEFGLERSLDDRLRSQGPHATEATVQNSRESGISSACHDRPILASKSVGNGHLASELDERLRSQGPRPSAGDEQNIGAKHHFGLLNSGNLPRSRANRF